MSDDLLNSIPEAHRQTAREALAAAFGASPISSLTPVIGGASGALTWRADVKDRPYLLRVETKRDFFRDPARGFACMQAAAAAGVAPALVHAEPGVAIMDFIVQRPLTEHPGGPAGIARELGELAARLQATPAFPPLADYLPLLNGMLNHLLGSGAFAPGLLDRHVAGFEAIRAVYPWEPSSLVSSHNDPNPRNILFDGERLWLIDWELSFRNDPLVDVAIIANDFAHTPEAEAALLTAWLGRAPDAHLRARLVLMRQLTRLFYGCLLAAAAGGASESDLTPMSVDAFRAAYMRGELKVGEPETMRALRKMVLAAYLDGLSAPGFEEALDIVGSV